MVKVDKIKYLGVGFKGLVSRVEGVEGGINVVAIDRIFLILYIPKEVSVITLRTLNLVLQNIFVCQLSIYLK